ncbi:LysR family transcriptional regulator [Methylobacterium sp. E-041]|jgi:DNA-binding transcriptional LysR family regulator|uniref:LysR family transcriptional regulator n=1 Tax=unclassified Methylobacterium TaxID=2615210 RepID=UPI001FB981D7|nr:MULTISPECIES: LysR family transcriptional regulator [unclassified Methylobacterium]MCJ2105817.1 LysR family transcriptional regulator [Methylobacterium sp. E-041]MCJ2113591.1 LysR family transcriptional regulator [Methylobacterium sp. E-025]
MFDWNDLTFFLELARHGRLMPAARRLKVDHTTVSRRIAELERNLDSRLFNRNSDGFALTEAGHKLFVIAEAIEQKMVSVPEALGLQDIAQPIGRVRVASMEGIAAFYLAAKFIELAAAVPDVVVELVTERHLINLTKREADISVSFVPPQGQRLRIKKVGEFRLALFSSERYLLGRGRPATRAELQDHDFVDYVDDLVAISPVHWLLEVLTPSNVVFRSTSMAAQQTAVAAGAGICLLPLFSAKTNPALVPVLPDEVVVRRDLYLGVHEDIECVGRVRAVTRFLTDLFTDEAAYLNEF